MLDNLDGTAYISANVSSGEQVKALRKAHGLRQWQLAEMLDVTQDTISKWETGVYRMTRRDSMAVVHAINEHKRKRDRKTA